MKFIIAFICVFFAASTALAQSTMKNLGKTTPVGRNVAWVGMDEDLFACPSPEEEGIGVVTVNKKDGVIVGAADIFNYSSNAVAELKATKASLKLIESKCVKVKNVEDLNAFQCDDLTTGVMVEGKRVYIMYSKG